MTECRGGVDCRSRGAPNVFARVFTWFFLNCVALVALLLIHFTSSAAQFEWWADVFAVSANLLTGALVSFLFYYLVVRLPEDRKKAVVKANLQRLYRDIKKDMLRAVVQASIKGGRYDLVPSKEVLDGLMTPAGFKAAFDRGDEADEGFYAFANQMHDETSEFRDIVLGLQMLSKQIEYVLHNYPVEDQRAFNFFKRLELILLRLQASGPGYDEAKALCRFIWDVYAGWNYIDGDIGFDQIEKSIADL